MKTFKVTFQTEAEVTIEEDSPAGLEYERILRDDPEHERQWVAKLVSDRIMLHYQTKREGALVEIMDKRGWTVKDA